jgi:hypothetical protein
MIADLKPYPEYKESGLPWLKGSFCRNLLRMEVFLWHVPGEYKLSTLLRELPCANITARKNECRVGAGHARDHFRIRGHGPLLRLKQ